METQRLGAEDVADVDEQRSSETGDTDEQVGGGIREQVDSTKTLHAVTHLPVGDLVARQRHWSRPPRRRFDRRHSRRHVHQSDLTVRAGRTENARLDYCNGVHVAVVSGRGTDEHAGVDRVLFDDAAERVADVE